MTSQSIVVLIAAAWNYLYDVQNGLDRKRWSRAFQKWPFYVATTNKSKDMSFYSFAKTVKTWNADTLS